jgi:hypothetical protein
MESESEESDDEEEMKRFHAIHFFIPTFKLSGYLYIDRNSKCRVVDRWQH